MTDAEYLHWYDQTGSDYHAAMAEYAAGVAEGE